MANSGGTITREDLITNEALKWGDEYAKELTMAIDKNKTFVESIKEINKLAGSMKMVETSREYKKAKQEEITLLSQASTVWKEQTQLENTLISTLKKRELATESTNRKLIEERVALQQTNKEVRQQARESLGLVGAYEKLNKKRTEAQRTLANLLSAEKQQPIEIAKARREFELLDARVKQIDLTTKNYTKNIGNYKTAFDGLGTSVKSVISALGVVTGLAFFAQTMRDIYSVIRDVDQQLIAVRKTTNMSNDEMALFRKEIIDLGDALDGISIQGLLKTSEIAGQLGIQGRANILKFSETIEKLKLTSDLVSDESVSAFAQFIQISSDSVENADRLGSVITELGNNFNATESKVLSNAAEIQRGIAVYNTAAQNVLALGSATASLGSEAETSRTAMQKTLGIFNTAISTGEGLERILKITGMTQAELSEQFNKDATVVFQKFIKGLNEIRKSGGNLKNTLDAVGLSEIRSFSVVGNLAANYEVLEDAMNRANTEYENNKALTDEAASSAESIASIVGDLRDRWEAYVLRLNDANNGTSKITTVLKYLRDNLDTAINRVIKIGAVFLTFIGVMKTVNFAMTAYNALKLASTAAQVRFALATGIGTKNILAQATAIRAATVAQEGMNTAMKATPWGLVLALLSAVAVAYYAFSDSMNEAEKSQERLNNRIKQTQQTEKEYADIRDKSRAERFKAIEDEIRLRKAQGEDAKKLDDEEIIKKQEVVQSQIDLYNSLNKAENERTQLAIDNAQKRVDAVKREMEDPANTDRYNKRLAKMLASDEMMLNEATEFHNKNIDIQKKEGERLLNVLADLNKQQEIQKTEAQRELSEKEKREAESRRKEYLARLKKQADDEFALNQFRLKNTIDLNKDILDSDTATLDERLDAFHENSQLETALIRETAEKKLKDISWYNDEIRNLTASEITDLLNGNDIKKTLRDDEVLIIEQYQASVLANTARFNKDKQALIDEEVKKSDDRVKAIVQNQDTELNNAIESRTKILQANLEGTNSEFERVQFTEQYEKDIFDLKVSYARKALEEQISAIETLMAENELSEDVERELLNDLSKYRAEKAQLDLETQQAFADKRIELEQQTIDRIKDLAYDLAYTLIDLTNAIFDSRIGKIDEEIDELNSYYDAQKELAGDNERQQQLLEEERVQKENDLKNKRRKEMEKQAIFNKTMAIAEIGISLAKTITAINLAAAQMDALAAWGFGAVGGAYRSLQLGMAIGTAAAQTAIVLAAPIPKYEKGTQNHKGGLAEVAEVRPEVILEPNKKPYIISDRSFVNLPKGTKVIPSVEEYEKMQGLGAMMSLDMELNRTKKYSENQAFSSGYGLELLNEMKEVNKNIKRNKTSVNVSTQKIDIPHAIFRSNNLTW